MDGFLFLIRSAAEAKKLFSRLSLLSCLCATSILVKETNPLIKHLFTLKDGNDIEADEFYDTLKMRISNEVKVGDDYLKRLEIIENSRRENIEDMALLKARMSIATRKANGRGRASRLNREEKTTKTKTCSACEETKYFDPTNDYKMG